MASAAPDRVDTMTTTTRSVDARFGHRSDRRDAARGCARSGRHARRRALRQGRVPESRRLGEGPRGGVDPPRGRAQWPADQGRDDSRRHLGQHRHRLRDDRRRAWLPPEAVHAGQRHARADAHAEGLRRRARADRSRWKAPTAPFAKRGGCSPPIRSATSTPISTTTTPTGARTTRPPVPRSSSRPKAASRTSSPGLGTSGTFMGIGRRLREFNPRHPPDLRQPDSPMHGVEGLEAHGDGDPCPASTTTRWRTRTSASTTERA